MGMPANFLRPYSNMVLGLSGAVTTAKGSIKLKVEYGSTSYQVKMNSEFIVIDTLSPYGAVMGQPLIFSLKAAMSLYYYSIKFSTPHGVGEVKGNRKFVEKCQLKAYVGDQCTLPRVYMAHVGEPELGSLDPQIKIKGEKLVEELEKVQTEPRCLRLEPWRHGGIEPNIICHKFQVDLSVRSKQQKRRPLNLERYESLNKKVQKLLHNGFLRETKYPKYLPLPRINQMVDAIAGHELLSFMDAYSRYNQISMYGPDQEHTSFVIDQGLYCYRVMSFGLKNTGVTYQRLVNCMFSQHIEKNNGIYVDDMLVKSTKAKDHCQHLTEMFDILRKYRKKLNPKKCAFGVSCGKFLGYIVNNRGIEANFEKIRVVIQMKAPTKPRGVQSLIGMIAALNRFVSKSTDRCKPFFDILTCQQCRPNSGRERRPTPSLLREQGAPQSRATILDLRKTIVRLRTPHRSPHQLSIKTNIAKTRHFRSDGQALVDFVSEFCNVPIDEPSKETPWELYVDGSSTGEQSGASVVLISPEQRIFGKALPFDFKTSNNVAEYETLIVGIMMVLRLGIPNLIIHRDSQLVVNQINGVYQNSHADALAHLATSERIEEFDSIIVRRILLSATELAEVALMMIDPKPIW
ncbi:uncharacterized protein LOC111369087 [Olea europaea var. sylvestris]|uniref:uncharacterized protein LOC111369087 n=1 Tax=Olea europaea var. sylvestris TaxID=158386 RepID=UPI000C1D370A|nr:uncharacterized protein LOC111369087 [Olea europaea var. sylvestris]